MCLFYLYTVDSKIYIVNTPTDALFIKLGKVLKIYIIIHINIATTCFGLRPSSGGMYCT